MWVEVVEESLAIIGGGIIGCASALALRDFFRVTIFEASPALGAGASQAAIGGITPQSDYYCRGILRVFADHSRRMYRNWLDGICEAAGLEIPYLDTGLLQVAVDDNEAVALLDGLVPEWLAQGFYVDVLDTRDLRFLEPRLSRAVRAACRLPAEGALEPRRLLAAVSRILHADERVEVLLEHPVKTLYGDESGVSIVPRDAATIRFDRCLLAAGAQTPELFPELVPHMIPVRGQAADVRTSDKGYPLRHHIYGRVPSGDAGSYQCAYLVPRHDGRVTIGVTYEHGEHVPKVTAGGLRQILGAASQLVPEADSWEVSGHWSGVRPGTLDGRPFIGFADEASRVAVATGHFGVGITLAPATAEMVKALFLTGTAEMQAAVSAPPQRFNAAVPADSEGF
jgi:glycine oxidase